MTDCSIDETSTCEMLRNAIVHLPIRHIWLDCKSGSLWDIEWETVFGDCNVKNLLTIDCTCSSVLCQYARQETFSESKHKGDLLSIDHSLWRRSPPCPWRWRWRGGIGRALVRNNNRKKSSNSRNYSNVTPQYRYCITRWQENKNVTSKRVSFLCSDFLSKHKRSLSRQCVLKIVVTVFVQQNNALTRRL